MEERIIDVRVDQTGSNADNIHVGALLGTLPFPVFILDEDHNVLAANKSFTEFVGKDIKDVRDANCHTLMHGTQCPVDGCPMMEVRETNAPVESEIFEPTLQKWLRSALYPTKYVTKEGKQIIVHLVQDISDKHRARELEKDIAKKEVYEFLISSLPIFAGAVSPEVRNSLVKKFGEKFELSIKPRYLEKAKHGSDDVFGSVYGPWLCDFLSNLGTKAEIVQENGQNGLRLNNCPWKEKGNDSPVFCMICRAMVVRSSLWTGLDVNIIHVTSIIEGAKDCQFEFRLGNSNRSTQGPGRSENTL